MPPQDSNPKKDKTPAPQSSASKAVPDDEELRKDWHSLSYEKKNSIFKSLPADKQVEFAQRVGMFEHNSPITFSAPPAWNSIKTEGMPIAIKAPSPSWMKEKAYQTLNWGANQLPNVGGFLGGLGGAALGESAEPIGGGVPLALYGAGVGGALGGIARQYVRHVSGMDKYDDPEDKTLGARTLSAAEDAGEQVAAEAFGLGLGRAMRPTLERSIAKLYSAGGIDYGDGMAEGRLKTVIGDLMHTEKTSGKAVTVKDLIDTIGNTKEHAGKTADGALMAPVTVGGRNIPLRDVHADPTPLADLIKSFATKDEGLVKRASLGGADPSVTAAKKYQDMVKQRALTFEQEPWTYGQLANERMRINQELSSYYAMTPGEKQAFLKDNPLLEVDKAIADHIRDITYPEMDKAAHFPKGTTKALQEKRGILMQMDTEVRNQLTKLQNKTVQAQGEGIVDKISPSGYVTSEGKPGGSFHRIQRLVHTPNGLASADKKVSQAFGHAPMTAARKAVTTPFGNKELGNQILSLPVKVLVDHPWDTLEDNSKPPEEPSSLGPESSLATPQELREKAKRLNPVAQGQNAYAHTAVNPQTGHKIGSNGDGWFDLQTGAKVA